MRTSQAVPASTLQQDGVISSWHYLGWDETAANRHGWAALWLACAVRIVPPELVLRPHTPAATASLIDDIPLGDDDTGALIKAERTLRGNISQSRAAKELACSPGYINKLEGDKPNKPRPSEGKCQNSGHATMTKCIFPTWRVDFGLL